MPDRFGAWEPDEVFWGEQECSRRSCGRLTEVLYDGRPLCIECADDLLERQLALELAPGLAAGLPAWEDAA